MIYLLRNQYTWKQLNEHHVNDLCKILRFNFFNSFCVLIWLLKILKCLSWHGLPTNTEHAAMNVYAMNISRHWTCEICKTCGLTIKLTFKGHNSTKCSMVAYSWLLAVYGHPHFPAIFIPWYNIEYMVIGKSYRSCVVIILV